MAELLILWGYIGIVNSCIGAGVLKGIGLLTGRKKIVYGLAGTELAGIVAITVYAQTVSIFGKVFMAAHLVQERASGDLEPGEEDMSFLGRCSLSDFCSDDSLFCIQRAAAYGYRNLSCSGDSVV